jgi:hypothetical protein
MRTIPHGIRKKEGAMNDAMETLRPIHSLATIHLEQPIIRGETDRELDARGSDRNVQTQRVLHLNQKELARRWRISPRTLERWRWLREGPSYLKIGGKVIYRLTEIEAFEAARVRVASCSKSSTAAVDVTQL